MECWRYGSPRRRNEARIGRGQAFFVLQGTATAAVQNFAAGSLSVRIAFSVLTVLTGLVLIPLGVLFVVVAFANRHLVTVTVDPFDADDRLATVTLPLFVLIIAVAIFGVVAGSVAPWFGQRRWRHRARQYETDARAARVE